MLQILDHVQDRWLGGLANPRRVIDPQIRGGICLALCYEWCVRSARGESRTSAYARQGADWQRMLSFQRAFNMQVDDQTRGLAYLLYQQRDEAVTHRFVTQNALREGVQVQRTLLTNVALTFRNAVQAIGPGDTIMIVIWGDDNGESFGHAIAIDWPATAVHPYFFDPNQGVFQMNDHGGIGADVVQNLDDEWDLNDINHFAIYSFA